MDILVADLDLETLSSLPLPSGAEGLELALSLVGKEGEDSFVIATSPEESYGRSPVNTFCVVWKSSLTGKTEYSFINCPHGRVLHCLGHRALVVKGRSRSLSYIRISAERNEIIPCENLRGESSTVFEDIGLTSPSDFALSTARAGDNGVKYASLQYKGRNVRGLGLGNAFASHNLKGIVFSDSTGVRKAQKLEIPGRKGDFMRKFTMWGSYSILSSASRLGWAPVRNYSDRSDPRMAFLDGLSMSEKYGVYPAACSACALSCDNRDQEGSPLPHWWELMEAGTNLGLFDPGDILRIIGAMTTEGLDISVTGAMLAHLFSLDTGEMQGYGLESRSVDDAVSFIHALGGGIVLPDGLSALPDALMNYDTRPFSVDLRGAWSAAIRYSLGLDFELSSTLVFPSREASPEAVATITLYETAYSLALGAMGLPSLYQSLWFWSSAPRAVYRSPILARLWARRFSAFGIPARTLLEKGLSIMDEMKLEWHPLPRAFTLESSSALDASTVPLPRLRQRYSLEKAMAEIWVKSRSEKRTIPSSERSAAVGPEDERGSAEEPGLR